MTNNKRKCPNCGKELDPRGYSGHVDNCDTPDIPEIEETENEEVPKEEFEDENPTPEPEKSEDYEEVNPGENVNTDPQTCVCGAYLYSAVEYRENIAYTLSQGGLTKEEVQYYKHLNETLKQYYAYCPECGRAFEKTEL